MNDGIIAFDLKGNLIHFNREAKKLLNRQYLDDIRFDRFFKEINANITLGDCLLYTSLPIESIASPSPFFSIFAATTTDAFFLLLTAFAG